MRNTTARSTLEAGVALAGRAAADEMTTLACPACKLALYMPIRKLQKAWQCPACRATIQT
jgi:hypothetical protein